MPVNGCRRHETPAAPVDGRGRHDTHAAPVDGGRRRQTHSALRGLAAPSPLLVAHGATLVAGGAQRLAQPPHDVADGADPELPRTVGVAVDVTVDDQSLEGRVLARAGVRAFEDGLPRAAWMRTYERAELVAKEQILLGRAAVQDLQRRIAARGDEPAH